MDEQYIQWAEFLMAEEAKESYYRAIAEELAQLPKDPVDWSITTAHDEKGDWNCSYRTTIGEDTIDWG